MGSNPTTATTSTTALTADENYCKHLSTLLEHKSKTEFILVTRRIFFTRTDSSP